MRVLNAAQMKEADRRTIEDIGIPSLVLMENAGRQAVAAMEAMYGDLLDRQVGVLCGRGNNGGDGFVVARTLAQRGVDVSVFLIGRVSEVRGDARINLEILGRLGLTVVEIADSQAWELHFSEVSDCTLIVDAIFGTGLNAPISGFIESVVTDVNASGIPVVAIDLPGHGPSPNEGGDARSMARYRDAVGGLAGALCLGPSVLVGHSMGALVAIEAALSTTMMPRLSHCIASMRRPVSHWNATCPRPSAMATAAAAVTFPVPT